jgi:eukaryotic-like serine/threonine-protein kinase
MRPGYEVLGCKVLCELGSRGELHVAYRVAEGRIQLCVLQYFRRLRGTASQLTATLRDARALVEVAHPNLMRVHRAAPIGEEVVVASEFVEGEAYATLGSLARERHARVPLDAHVQVLLQTLAGLAALHSTRDARRRTLGLVHGALSPADVIVGLDGRACVVGALRAQARRVSPEAAPYRAYLAPEVLAGDRPVDRRADVYAVGIMLWEALAGERLFEDMSARAREEILSRHLRAPIARPSLSGELAWAAPIADVALRALAFDAEERFASAEEMAAALRACARNVTHESAASAASVVRRLAGERIRRRRAELVAAASLQIELEDEAVTAVASRPTALVEGASSSRAAAIGPVAPPVESEDSTTVTGLPLVPREGGDRGEHDERDDDDATTQLALARPKGMARPGDGVLLAADGDDEAETLTLAGTNLDAARAPTAPTASDPTTAQERPPVEFVVDDLAIDVPPALAARSSAAVSPPISVRPAVVSPALALRGAIVEVGPISEEDAYGETVPLEMPPPSTMATPVKARPPRYRRLGVALGLAFAGALALFVYVLVRAANQETAPNESASLARTKSHHPLEFAPLGDVLAPSAKGLAATSSPTPRKLGSSPRPAATRR